MKSRALQACAGVMNLDGSNQQTFASDCVTQSDWIFIRPTGELYATVK